MTIATPFLVLWLLILIFKASHVIAVSRWLLRHGPAVARRAGRPNGEISANADAFRKAFASQGSERPRFFMVFGVKDVRIYEAIKRHKEASHWAKLGLWRTLAALWHAIGLVSVTVVLLFVAAYWKGGIAPADTGILFAAGLAILLLMFLMGVEMIVLMVTIGPWLPYYHRLKTAENYPDPDGRVRETMRLLYVSAGASIVTLFAMAGVICFASRQTNGIQPKVSDVQWFGALESVARSITVLGTVGDGLNSSTVYGALLTIFLVPLVLTYIAFLVPIAASVVNLER